MNIVDIGTSNILDLSNPGGYILNIPIIGETINDGDSLVFNKSTEQFEFLPSGQQRRSDPLFSCDFLTFTNAQFSPFTSAAIASGTLAAPNFTDANHPGIVRFRSSTSANSGYLIGTNSSQIRLKGGEVWEQNFYIDALTNNTFRFAFHNSTSSSDATDGCYLEIASTGVATGKTANNSTRSSTATTTTLLVATWYRLKVEISSDLGTVTYTIFTDDGTVVWTDSLTTNIPVGRSIGAAAVATNSGTTTSDLFHLDRISLLFSGLVR